MTERNWQDWINLVVGVWLFLSPWLVFAALGAAAWNAWTLGVLIILVSVLALGETRLGAEWEWINFVVGLWLILSPWLLGFGETTAAVWNTVVAGLIVCAVSGRSLARRRSAPERAASPPPRA